MYPRANTSELIFKSNLLELAENEIPAGNPNLALMYAFQLLDIDENAYANIHSLALKKEFLLYKLLFAEFEFTKPQYEGIEDRLLNIIETAYQFILQSPITNNANTIYSPHSIGLSELDLRTTRVNKEIHSNISSLEQSVLPIGEKKGGVEPGFEAIHAKDVLMHLFKKFPDQQERIQFIKSKGNNIPTLYEAFHNELPKYMVKLDYKELQNKRVVPSKEDLKRAKTIQDFYAKGELIGDVFTWFYQQSKAVSSIDKNCEAVLEVAANDVARLFMTVQHQTLYQGRFDDGTLKLLLKAEWINGASTLAPIAGGTKDNNYCVKPILLPLDGIKFISDNSIKALAEKLPILIIQNDRDAIGSKGQNKLRKGNEFIAIDFGHAYQSTRSVIDSLTSQFHLTNPQFKNYSVFYDAPRSDIIRGLIKLAALAGHAFNPAILKSYGDDFAAEISSIIPHTDEKIFDDYVQKFEEMKLQFKSSPEPINIKLENIKCCDKIIETLKKAKIYHITGRDKLIERFTLYLPLSSQAIDLMENIEKLSTPITQLSLRSPDNTVILNHIRMPEQSSAQWGITLGDNGEHTLTGQFENEPLAQQASLAITEMLPSKTSDLCTTHLEGKKLSITFKKEYLPVLHNIFAEDKIKEKYFKHDFELYNHFMRESELTSLLASFKPYGFDITCSPLKDDGYLFTCHLTQHSELGKTYNTLFKQYLDQFKIHYIDADKQLSFSIQPNGLLELSRALSLSQEKMNNLELAYSVFSEINQLFLDSKVINQYIMLALNNDDRGFFTLELLNTSDNAEESRCKKILTMKLSNSGFEFDKTHAYFIIPFEKLALLNKNLLEFGEHYPKLMNNLASQSSSTFYHSSSSISDARNNLRPPTSAPTPSKK